MPTGHVGGASAVPRRALLAGAAAGLAGVLLSGCSGGGIAGAGTSAEGAGLRRRAARDSAELLAHYRETARAHPELDRLLTPFREVTAAHVAALREPGADAVGPAGQPPAVPAGPDAALGALAGAERRLADERFAALAAAPPDVARLLASLAAAGSAQALLLDEAQAAGTAG